MAEIPKHPPIELPARQIPVPSTVSSEAQTVLAITEYPAVRDWPDDLTDRNAVAKVIDDWVDDFTPDFCAAIFGTSVRDISDTKVEYAKFGDTSVYIAEPSGAAAEDQRALLMIHGSFIFGAGDISRQGAAYTAEALGIRTWAVDYRMPPHHPYPAALDDCLMAYREMVTRYGAENVAIGGISGGGNLALASLLRAKDEGLPLPFAALVYTPYADLTHSGDSHATMAGIDISTPPGNLRVVRAIYLGDHDPRDPYISPVFGNFTAEFPPTMLCSGTRDFLLSETVRVHRRMLAAGIEAELHVWEAALHYMFASITPEDRERDDQARKFLAKHWRSTAT